MWLDIQNDCKPLNTHFLPIWTPLYVWALLGKTDTLKKGKTDPWTFIREWASVSHFPMFIHKVGPENYVRQFRCVYVAPSQLCAN